MDRQRRLARLEGESHLPQDLGERRWPSDHNERSALAVGLEAWRTLMRSCGWTDEEINDELEWDAIVGERCDASGFEDFEIMSDMITYFEAGGVLRFPPPALGSRKGRGC